MIYLLAASLASILVIAFILSKCDIFSPWVIITACFLNSTCLAMLNVDYWGFTFHLNTCLVILSGVIFFGCGSLFSNSAFKRVPLICYVSFELDMKRCYLFVGLSTILIAAFSYLSLKELYQVSIQYGNTEGYSNIVRTLRPLIEAKVFDLPRDFAYMSLVGMALSFTFLAIAINNIITQRRKIKNLIFLIPFIAYIPMILLSTGRLAFLHAILFSIVIGGILYQKKYGCSKYITIKLLACILGAMILFFICFFLSGHLTGKVITADRTPFVIISHYTGAQIPALDIQLNSYLWNDTNNIGEITLLGLYGNLRHFGFNLPQTSMFLPFIQLNHVTTNVYTSLFRYIHDYGMIGMWVITFTLGIFYTTLYNIIKYKSKSFLLLMIYAYISLALFLFGHDEIFLTIMVASRNIYLFVIMALLISMLKVRMVKK